jgi:phospholipase C
MDTRRSFLKKSAFLSGAAAMAQVLPPSIQRALAIDPKPGSTFMDAEHIVLLMQENRSFDHTYGTLRGVRGFNDPRAISLPNKNKVWAQTNKNGETYSPFRLNIKDTKITWMGSLPHGRQSQVDARNEGRYDNWLEAKKSDNDDNAYINMPLTMGYYTREDIPFYYALADAFTVCDQNFCSSLTGTDPNRSYFWSGTVRAEHKAESKPYVQNDDIEAGIQWDTFPERLEKEGISWKVYQNEVSAEGGFTGEEDVWLANFGDNVLEFFKQYNVKLTKRFIDYLPKKIERIKQEIKTLEDQNKTETNKTKHARNLSYISYLEHQLRIANEDLENCTHEKFDALSEHEKNIHHKAFVTNTKDPDQHKLTPLNYTDENIGREINIPKGDIFHQFREDVKTGNLPTVSWLVAPEFFSDHPSAPWFGSWYLSEAMDILTQNPEVWKKTIFVLAYDENDGYFDHVPPFVAPDPRNAATGKVSKGIDTITEHVLSEADAPGSIGLGYRVPLVIASPWTRGGWVNSQVFDHTSTLQFLEKFLSKKFGKNIEEPNITKWRRTVCGDLTSVFRKDDGKKTQALPFLAKDVFIESVHKAKFKNVPNNFKKLTTEEIAQLNNAPHLSPYMPKQEPGTKPSCALPYELDVDGVVGADKTFFLISMSVSDTTFGERSAGAPFTIYTHGKDFKTKNYAVATGDQLFDETLLSDFENGNYDIRLCGPNGFFRGFKGNKNDHEVHINFRYENRNFDKPVQAENTGRIVMSFINPDLKNKCRIKVVDNAYKSFSPMMKDILNVNETTKPTSLIIDTAKTGGWYDFSVFVEGNDSFEKRYAGRVETGKHSITDPVMGGVV